jgi:multidrug efflux pump subunit AcrA (membrane-fusion protein)
MDEKEFIYGRLHYLQDQVNNLTNILDRQQDLIANLVSVIEQMQSPDYARRQVETAKAADVAEKIKFIREHFNKK